jgi:hypothetical protein
MSGGKGGPPSAVDQSGVPPNVIKMQVRIDDEVDLGKLHASAP